MVLVLVGTSVHSLICGSILSIRKINPFGRVPIQKTTLVDRALKLATVLVGAVRVKYGTSYEMGAGTQG
jgi:hypothetical protein